MLTILLFRDAKEMEKQQQEKFAIGFAQFSINYNYDSMHKVWIRYDKNEIFATKDLLEIYKKNIMKQTAVEWLLENIKDVNYNTLEKNGYTIALERIHK